MMTALDLATQAGSHQAWMGGPGPWWIVFPIIWVIAIATIVWLFARRKPGPDKSGPAALEILETRYARGDIDTDEYRRRRDEIRGLT